MNENTSLDWRHIAVSLVVAGACMVGYAVYAGLWSEWFPPNDFPDETLPQPHIIDFYSHQIDDRYQLYVQLPHGYDDNNERYPVVYATDGGGGPQHYKNTILPMLRRGQIPQMIFVGIANASRRLTNVFGDSDATRLRDFSYSSVATPAGQQGNENFHRFIEENIKPFINATYRTIPEESAIGGHSLGGLFSLYALFRHPDSYKYYFASSPTLFWNDSRIFEEEESFHAANKPLPVFLYMSAAERESPVLIDHYHQMVRILNARNYEGFKFKTEVHANHTHGSVVAKATEKGLRYLFGE